MGATGLEPVTPNARRGLPPATEKDLSPIIKGLVEGIHFRVIAGVTVLHRRRGSSCLNILVVLSQPGLQHRMEGVGDTRILAKRGSRVGVARVNHPRKDGTRVGPGRSLVP